MIRSARFEDFDRIMEMMIDFANHAPFDSLHKPEYDDWYIRKLLGTFLKSGVLLVAEHQNRVEGMLIAQLQQDAWLPHVKTLKEVAWWVDPVARHTSLGYRLLKEYVKRGKAMQNAGAISAFTLTNMEISPDFDLEKRGWRPVERNYVYEGA